MKNLHFQSAASAKEKLTIKVFISYYKKAMATKQILGITKTWFEGLKTKSIRRANSNRQERKNVSAGVRAHPHPSQTAARGGGFAESVV